MDIWTLDLERDALTRLTFDKGVSTDPVWTPDGKSVIFSSARSGPPNIFSKPSDGSGQAIQLSNNEEITFACSVFAGWQSRSVAARGIRYWSVESR